MTAKRALALDPKDTVALALEEVQPGDEVEARCAAHIVSVTAIDRIPFGFKIALVEMTQGDPIYKYGEIIGVANRPIRRGEMIHIHNLSGSRGRGDVRTVPGEDND